MVPEAELMRTTVLRESFSSLATGDFLGKPRSKYVFLIAKKSF